jgi:phosphate transport system substrate-binding protein
MHVAKSSVWSLTLVALVIAPAFVQAQQVNIAGASTMKPLLEDAARDFTKSHAGVKFAIGAGGSAKGIELAGKGEVQIGTTCRHLNANDKSQYADLVEHQIGVDANGVMLNTANPVQKLTAEQVRGIYTGKITNWKEVGGNDAAIVLLSFSPKHSSYEVFLEYFKLDGNWANGKVSFKEKGAGDFSATTIPTVDATADLTASLITKPNGIAFGSVGAALAMASKGAPLKLAELDGVPATEASVLDGSYPLPRPLSLLTKGEPSGTAKEFLDYLKSDAGQNLLKSKGFFVPK